MDVEIYLVWFLDLYSKVRIDYDEYINQYILKNRENNSSDLSQNVVSEIILDQNDTILQEVIESIDIETDAIDILSYFGYVVVLVLCAIVVKFVYLFTYQSR